MLVRAYDTKALVSCTTFLIVTFNRLIPCFLSSCLYLSRKASNCSVGMKYSCRRSVVCGSGFCRNRTGTAIAVFLLTILDSTDGVRLFSKSQRKLFPMLLVLDAWKMTLRNQMLFSPCRSSARGGSEGSSVYR